MSPHRIHDKGKTARVILAAFWMVMGGFLSAQEAVKNPDKPSSPNAGRVLGLKEELRITDAGGEYFLRSPRFIKTAPNGQIYIYDRDELLQLDPRGRFLRNLYKKGQGPGELNYISNFEPVGELLLVHSNSPAKLVWFDAQGNVVKEISLAAEGGRLDLLFRSGGRSYFFKQGVPISSGKTTPSDLPFSLWSISDDGSRSREVTTFLTKVIAFGGAFMWDGLQTAVVNDRYLFVGYANPYAIKVYDLKEERLLRSFSRPYKRLPSPKESRGAIISKDGRRFEMPGSEYLDDIAALFAVGDALWVRTSTMDPEKGILFDVYNVEGRYTDAFYLKTAGRPLAVEGDAVFIVEKTPDETIEIAKYRIVR
jgi:hypothetical protein